MSRICIAIGDIGCGGAERAASTLANYLAGQDHEVYILTALPVPAFYSLDQRIRLVLPDVDPRLKGKFLGALWITKFLRRKLVEIAPDSVVDFLSPSYFMLISMGLKLNIFISIRNDPSNMERYDSIFLRKILFAKAKGIIAQTEYAKELLKQQTNHKNITAIPNFVKPVLEIKSSVIKEKTIICVARLKKGKGHDRLLDIFSVVNAKRPGWRLSIVGDGPERANLILQSKVLGISDRVDFKGAQKNVDEHLQSASIFAFCSQSEGFPNALLEAMASPLPCIAYDCIAGPSEIINDGVNGFLIPLNDKNMFINKLLLLMDDSITRARFQNEAVLVREKFSVDRLGNKYLTTILNP